MSTGQDVMCIQWSAVSLFVLVVMGCCQCQARKKQSERCKLIIHDDDYSLPSRDDDTERSPPLSSPSTSVSTASSPSVTSVSTPGVEPRPLPNTNITSSNSSSSNNIGNDYDGEDIDNDASLPPTWRTGEVIRFSSWAEGDTDTDRDREGGCSWDLLVERLPDSFLHSQQRDKGGGGGGGGGGRGMSLCVALALPSKPYERLRISNMETGALDWSGKAADKDSCWVVTTIPSFSSPSSPSHHMVTLTHNFYSKKKGQGRLYSFVLAYKNGGWIAESCNATTERVETERATETSVSDTVTDSTTTTTRLPQWRVQALQLQPQRSHLHDRHHHCHRHCQSRRREKQSRGGLVGPKETTVGAIASTTTTATTAVTTTVDKDGREQKEQRGQRERQGQRPREIMGEVTGMVPARPLTETQLLSFVHQVTSIVN